MPNRGAIVLNVYSGRMVFLSHEGPVQLRLWCDFSCSDLQILRSSLIITSLFGDAARFRCGDSSFKFIFTIDRIAIRNKRSGMEKPSKIAPAKGKLGVLLPGMGAILEGFSMPLL